MAQPQYDVVILGAGPAGATAGIFLGRFRFKCLLLETMATTLQGETETAQGGRSSYAGLYRNVPGYPEGIGREDLKWRCIEHARHAGCDYRLDKVRSIEREHAMFTVYCQTRNYTAESLIVALGIDDVLPSLPGIEGFVGQSLFWSVEANGSEALGKSAGVLGHDERAVLEALRLNPYTQEVYLFTEDTPLAVDEILLTMLNEMGVQIVSSRIKTVQVHNGTVAGVILENNEAIPVDVIYAPSHERRPRSKLVQDLGVHTDAAGLIQVNERFETNIPNVYAIGDVSSRGPELVVTAYYHGMQVAYAMNEERFHTRLHHLLARTPRQTAKS